MPSIYLAPAEYAAYGVPAATPLPQVVQAGEIVNQIVKRPEGLVWVPDATGAPAYMAGLTPTMTYTLTTPIAPGTNVPATIAPAIATPDLVGDVLIIARGDTGVCEAVVVSAVTGRDSITLDTVRYAHAAAATLDAGLTITEERGLPGGRNITRVSRGPIVNVLGLQGRYGYGRRSDQIAGDTLDFNIFAAVQAFGSTPSWVTLNPRDASISPSTGEVWVPAGLLMTHFRDVRTRYVAGYAAANLPPAVKIATATLIAAVAGSTDVSPQVRMYRAGDTSITRFGASNVDPDTAAMLKPYEARTFF